MMPVYKFAVISAFLIACLVPSILASESPAEAPTNDWKPIPIDGPDGQIQRLGKYVVKVYNRRAGANLKFIKVVHAEELPLRLEPRYLGVVRQHPRPLNLHLVVVLSWIVNPSLGCLSNDTKQLGEWKKIDDLNDPKIQAIAKFALEEGGKMYVRVHLTFVRVDQGKQQKCKEGTLYELLIVAYSRGFDQVSEAQRVQPYRKHQELVYFGLYDFILSNVSANTKGE
uniref:Cystatin domain-containing protein n=1 Tax=Kalanchoe fedtschenkoi TaxID=63787 RepID=A0A7N0UQ68_KALFE